MPDIEQQLRTLARHLDDHVEPVRPEDIVDAGTITAHRTRGRSLRRGKTVALVAALAAAASLVGVLALRDHDGRARVRVTSGITSNPAPSRAAPSTSPPSTSAPRTQPCVLRHPPGDLYSLAQPASITLPGGRAIPIVPGNPITRPRSVTLDSDGSTYPGQANNDGAASLLWGAATAGDPFAGLDRTAVGARITLHQTLRTGSGIFDCTQHWRIVRVLTPPFHAVGAEPTLLRLVGFTPHGALGPDVTFYVDAVPV